MVLLGCRQNCKLFSLPCFFEVTKLWHQSKAHIYLWFSYPDLVLEVLFCHWPASYCKAYKGKWQVSYSTLRETSLKYKKRDVFRFVQLFFFFFNKRQKRENQLTLSYGRYDWGVISGREPNCLAWGFARCWNFFRNVSTHTPSSLSFIL